MALLVPEGMRTTSTDTLCSILEVMYYMARADGVFSHEELAHFLKVAEGISGGRVTPGHLGVLVSGWAKLDGMSPEERILEIAASMTDAYEREMVCNLAAQLAEADDAVLGPEQQMLDFLGRAFAPRDQS